MRLHTDIAHGNCTYSERTLDKTLRLHIEMAHCDFKFRLHIESTFEIPHWAHYKFTSLLIIETPAVNPHLVLNYVLAIFPNKSRPTQLSISKPSSEHSRRVPEFSNQNERQIGQKFLSYDHHTNKQTENTIYIDILYL